MSNARLSFDQFTAYAHAYLARRDTFPTLDPPGSSKEAAASSLSWFSYARGWQWLDPLFAGAVFQPTACLSRSFSVLTTEPTSNGSSDQYQAVVFQEEHFDAEQAEHNGDREQVLSGTTQLVTITQSIHWSKIWQLPIIYFHASTHSGQPLTLDQLKQLNLVYKVGTLPNQPQGDGDGFETAVSIADHPRTGLPSYYLHPCHTNQALASLVQHARLEQEKQAKQDDHVEQEGWSYLAAFISLCASAMEMRAE